ncbi:hypothetical protein L228DRAFT_149852 [Xylona heveae TC161]|uniref:Uncharacterized protein n=1 Tax=Xylona heveae (strain CBS 132557 / TC161) TaxID=1328760 RepID=A0A165GK41_XYLHT|nr:hypothetical protein L228DRAFT_149852 [Xylona heveae TC161]KZF22289.1 hypothetical protein L228DRAFT_149852 [Xylona heveae TC161]
MSYYPTSTTSVQTVGLREVCEVNGRGFWRRKGTQQWIEYDPGNLSLPPAEAQPLYLSLVQEAQGEGEPLHWALHVGCENQPGSEYQVTGDAECMVYQPANDADITNSESFLNLYQLAVVTEEQAMVVKQIADSEPPPRAPNRQSVTENCQGWTVRVIAKLVERGIVPSGKLQMARSMMQPV